jgi:hypothetical protein
MADKKTARQTATEIEAEQNFPILNKYNRTAAGAVEKMSPGVAKEMARGAALAGMVPAGLLQIGQSSVTGRKGRSQEEMDELTREVGRAQRADKKANGGAVKSASARADGIAQRGKTRGKVC